MVQGLTFGETDQFWWLEKIMEKIERINGCFLKWWYPTTMGFPTKNDPFGVFWGYNHLRKPPNITENKV